MVGTPSSKVLGITELLESILLALPLKDILLSQRVCKAWRHTTCGSVMLQQALFFKAAGPVVDPDGEWPRVDPVGNPLITPLINSNYTGSGRTRLDRYGDVDLHASWDYPTASWRSMLLTQPPLNKVVAEIELRVQGMPYKHLDKDIKRSSGVVAWDVVRRVKDERVNLYVYDRVNAERVTALFRVLEYKDDSYIKADSKNGCAAQ